MFRELRLTARVCLLILLMVVRGTFFFVEQPSSSLLENVPYFKHMMTMVGQVMPMYKGFLPGAYYSPSWHTCFCTGVCMLAPVFPRPSWMGSWGHFSAKGSLGYGNVLQACKHLILAAVSALVSLLNVWLLNQGAGFPSSSEE